MVSDWVVIGYLVIGYLSLIHEGILRAQRLDDEKSKSVTLTSSAGLLARHASAVSSYVTPPSLVSSWSKSSASDCVTVTSLELESELESFPLTCTWR